MINPTVRSDSVQYFPTMTENSSSRLQRIKQAVIRIFEAIQNFFSRLWDRVFPKASQIEEGRKPDFTKEETGKKEYAVEMAQRAKMEALVLEIPKGPALLQKNKVHKELLPKAQEFQTKQADRIAAEKEQQELLKKHQVKFKPILEEIQTFDPETAPSNVMHLDKFRDKNFENEQLINLKKRVDAGHINSKTLVQIFEKYAPEMCEEVYVEIGTPLSWKETISNAILRRSPIEKSRGEKYIIGKKRLEEDHFIHQRVKPYVQRALEEAIAEKTASKTKILNQEHHSDSSTGPLRPAVVVGSGTTCWE